MYVLHFIAWWAQIKAVICVCEGDGWWPATAAGDRLT